MIYEQEDLCLDHAGGGDLTLGSVLYHPIHFSRKPGSFYPGFFKGAGGIYLLPILLAQKKKIDRDTLIGSFLMGVFAFAGCLFQQLGIIYSTVSKSSFITALYIVFVPVIELLLGKKVNQKIWLSVGIAIAGLYFLCMNSVSGINIGDLFLLCGAFVFALQIIAIDRYAGKCDPLTLTFYHRQWLPAWP